MAAFDEARVTAYTWDNAMVEGRRRLALLERTLDPATFRGLESIGVAEGWRCLDVGAGGGTVCEWLCQRVGPTGHVVAVDLDARFLRALPHDSLEVREESILESDLSPDSFDLVHTRWTLLHIPERERVLRRLIELVKPGGTLFLEEADTHPVETLDRTGWHDVSMRVLPVVASRGSKGDWARHLPHRVSELGLVNVRAVAEIPYFRGGSDLAEFWKMSWSRVLEAVAASGEDVSQWSRELAELDDPKKWFVGPMTVGVVAQRSSRGPGQEGRR